MTRKTLAILALLLLLAGHPFVTSEAEYGKGYSFGVFPYLPSARMETIYAPIAQAFGEVLGQPVHLRTRSTYRLFREELQQENYDVVYIQPFDFVREAGHHGYIPLVRAQRELHAVFVGKPGRSIHSIADFKDLSIVMPSKDSAVSLLGEIELKQAGLIWGKKISIFYENNHFSCMKRVLIGKGDICVTAPSTLKIFNNKSGGKLQRLLDSRKVPGSMYAVHRRVGAADRAKLKKLLLNLSATEKGRKLVKSTRLGGFVEAHAREYDVVRAIWQELSEHDHTRSGASSEH